LTIHPCNLAEICRSHRKKRRGVAVVEFAVVAPVFILLVFGMIEYGRMVMVQQVITNASREGARRGVLDGAQFADVENAVDNYLTAAQIDTANVVIDVNPNPPSSQAAGLPVTITVSVPYDDVGWLPSPMYLGGKTMTATSVMRRETVE